MRFGTATNRDGEPARPACRGRRLVCRTAAFTLAEVLVAMLFMAIVIPVVVEALHVSSVAGEISTRKAEAARVADRILNENIVTTNWNTSILTGTAQEGRHEFRWTLKNQFWPTDSTLQLLTAEVTFTAGGRELSVSMNTLASSPTLGAGSMGMQ